MPPNSANLLAEHGGLVWSICRRLSPEPEDAYQEVWEKVLRALPALDPDRGSLRGWIATVAHRHLVDRHRRRRVRGDVQPAPDLPSGGPDVERLAAGRESMARLERALTTLPDEQRRVVVLHHVHGLSLEEIATGEGVAMGTVKSRLHRGRAALVGQLREIP